MGVGSEFLAYLTLLGEVESLLSPVHALFPTPLFVSLRWDQLHALDREVTFCGRFD